VGGSGGKAAVTVRVRKNCLAVNPAFAPILWTGVLIAVASGLLVAPLGAEPPDLDDKAVLERILAEAIPRSQLEKRGEPGEELVYLPNEQSGYSGWVTGGSPPDRLFRLRDGVLDGPSTEWYEDGQKQGERTYKDGVLNGPYTMWYQSGQQKSEGAYKDGESDRAYTRWYENGQKQEEGTYKDGVPHGPVTAWYEDGQKKAEGTYKDGKFDGPFTTWHENGQIKEESTYKDGVLDGLFTEWTENGVKIGEVTYKDGVIVD
jgi:antitoxin component YwqK of YwqJK toxin-antitoxin module